MSNSNDASLASPGLVQSQARQPRFELGQILSTPGAVRLLDEHRISLFDLLARHVCLDSEVCAEDAKANENAVHDGDRVLSVFYLVPDSDDTRVWIITEADRSSTTCLLPAEY